MPFPRSCSRVAGGDGAHSRSNLSAFPANALGWLVSRHGWPQSKEADNQRAMELIDECVVSKGPVEELFDRMKTRSNATVEQLDKLSILVAREKALRGLARRKETKILVRL